MSFPWLYRSPLEWEINNFQPPTALDQVTCFPNRVASLVNVLAPLEQYSDALNMPSQAVRIAARVPIAIDSSAATSWIRRFVAGNLKRFSSEGGRCASRSRNFASKGDSKNRHPRIV